LVAQVGNGGLGLGIGEVVKKKAVLDGAGPNTNRNYLAGCAVIEN